MLHTTFRQLEVFVAVVEAGSFVGGADRLGISQPAVSNHIRALESQVGCQVLERRRGTVCVLTRDGRNLYEKALDLLDRASVIAADLPRTAGQSERIPLKILAPFPIANRWLLPHLPDFIGQHPNVQLSLEMGSFEEVAARIREAEVDIAYFHSGGPIAEFPSQVVGLERHGIFASKHHSIIRDRARFPDCLNDEPLIMPRRNSHFYRIVEKNLREKGIRHFRTACEVLDAPIIRELILKGHIASLFHYMLADEIAAGEVIELVELPPIEVRQVFQPRAISAKAAESFSAGILRLNRKAVESRGQAA